MKLADLFRVPINEHAFIDNGDEPAQSTPANHQHHHNNNHHSHSHHHINVNIQRHAHGRDSPLPEALPFDHHWQHIPNRVEAMGNVYVKDAQELQAWLLVARRVTREEAEKRGGCIIFTPSASPSAASGKEERHYYCISDSDDAVYGRARYQPRSPPPAPAHMSKRPIAVK